MEESLARLGTHPRIDDSDAWVEVANVKDSVTSGMPLRNVAEGSTGVPEKKAVVDEVDLKKDFVGTVDIGIGGKSVASTGEKS